MYKISDKFSLLITAKWYNLDRGFVRDEYYTLISNINFLERGGNANGS